MNEQDLKNSILQLAVQGKLVEQREEEEGTAKELLKQIKAEKERLIKEKKIRSVKSLGEITEEEIPFDIPESWEWVRFLDIIDVRDGTHDTPKYVSKGIPLITSKNLVNGKIDFDNIKLISSEDAEEINKRSGVDSGDILFAMIGSIGNPVKVVKEREFSIKNMALFKTIDSSLFNMEYLLWYLQLEQEYMKKKARGAVQSFVSLTYLRNYLIPLPPIEEQKRIVAKIQELMPYTEKYGEAYCKVEELNKKFPEDMEKSILQYAIQGRLVEQREEDGTAEELYKQIQEEKKELIKEGKIKRAKALPEITEDEIPFDIPESWKWVRLGNLSSLVTKGTTPRGGNVSYIDEGIGFLRAENVAGFDKLNLDCMKFVDESIHNTFLKRSILEENDILITIAGTLGRTAIVNRDSLPLNANQAVSLTRLIKGDLLNLKYLVYAINAPIIQSILVGKKKITAIPNLTLENINDCILPLPPLAEQKRIVEKIEGLLPYSEQLIKKIK